MKRLLIGAGAIAATAFAIKKVIDYELADKEDDLYDCDEELGQYHYDDEEDFDEAMARRGIKKGTQAYEDEAERLDEELFQSQNASFKEDNYAEEVDNDDVDEEELRRIFEEGSRTVSNIASDVYKGVKGFLDSLPKVNINVSVESRDKEKKN